MDGLTLFGLFAVTAMLVSYALEAKSHWYILAFAIACGLGSIYGFLQGAWPFGVVEAIWALVALSSHQDKGDPAASPERSDAFGDRGFRTREVSQAKIANHRVERAIRKRQMLDLCYAKVDAGIGFCRKLNHPWREIDADSPST